jgi:hypothetical protein
MTLALIMQVDALDRDPGPNTVIMGMVRQEAWAPVADGMGLPSRHCWVKLKPWCQQDIAAHEAGHGFGMMHIMACGEWGPFEYYPYPSKQIGAGGVRDSWGTDLREHPPKVLPSTDVADIMTYCFDLGPWISNHTYAKLRLTLRAGMGWASAADAASDGVVPPTSSASRSTTPP